MRAGNINWEGISAAAVDQHLPRTFFIMRGHICAAFGFSRKEVNALVANGTFVAKYPVAGGRARFVRSQVLAVAKAWELAR